MRGLLRSSAASMAQGAPAATASAAGAGLAVGVPSLARPVRAASVPPQPVEKQLSRRVLFFLFPPGRHCTCARPSSRARASAGPHCLVCFRRAV